MAVRIESVQIPVAMPTAGQLPKKDELEKETVRVLFGG
jgi:hypothetical protein